MPARVPNPLKSYRNWDLMGLAGKARTIPKPAYCRFYTGFDGPQISYQEHVLVATIAATRPALGTLQSLKIIEAARDVAGIEFLVPVA